jgi:hypothetical protein
LKRFLIATAALLAVVAVSLAVILPPKRLNLSAPWTDGTIPGILHIHSARSDGRGTLDDIARAAAHSGLKFIVVTDHGDATRSPEPPAYRDGVLCLDAVEISTTGGHYIAMDMPKAPYPLGGEPRDVVDDVRRLGGFGIVAHPDSPKTELQWRDWTAPFDAIEIINPDTSWRQQMTVPESADRMSWPKLFLVQRLFSYPIRPAESIASLIQPTGILDQWDETARRHRVVTIAGADAHAQIAWRSSDPAETRLALPIPGYESSFQSMSVRIRPEKPLTGNATTDAAIVVRAIRSGHLYTAVDGAATPPAFEFTATNARGTAHAGDRLGVGGPVMLRVRSNAPPEFTTTIWDGAKAVSGDHHEQDFSFSAPDRPAVYWVEIRAAARLPQVPWVTSNPIYVRDGESPAKAVARPAAGVVRPLLPAIESSNWRVEHDATSLAAVDAVMMTTSPDGTGTAVPTVRLRFGLSGGTAAGQYAALVSDQPAGVTGSDRIAFTVRTEQPMRVSVQLRSARGRWQRSVYVDTTYQDRTVYFDEMIPAGASEASKPALAEIRSILLVVDSTNTRPGTSGRVWITQPRLER